MAYYRQFKLYLRKNAIQKGRHACQTCCEVLTPVVLVALFALLYSKVGLKYTPDTTYECDSNFIDNTLYDFVYLPRVLNATYSRLALVGPAGSTVVSDFTSHAARTYPGMGTEGDELGPGGLNCTLLTYDSTAGTGAPPYVPPLVDYLMPFPDEGSLESYVTGQNYGTDGSPTIFAAVVWTSVPAGSAGAPGQWAYKLRFNASFLPADTKLSTNDLVRGLQGPNLAKYSYGSVSLPSAPSSFSLAVPGFIPLQTAVDRFLIGRAGTANDTGVDAEVDRLAFLGSWGCSKGWNGTEGESDPAVLAALARLAAFYTSHTLTPQRAAVAPFPTAAYYNNDFYSFVSSTFALVFVMSFFLPAFFLIRAVVAEKEGRLREGMRMMGMQDGPMTAAWYATYGGLLFLVVAILIAIICSRSFFPVSDGGILFLFFWSFGWASTSLCMLLSVFFSRAKLAAVVGAVLFLASFFPYFSVNAATVSPSLKFVSSLSAPTAFGLGIDVLSTLEGNGVGVTWPTVAQQVNGYSMNSALWWLFGDTVLYAILAWYLGAVFPQEYGTPLPWWFPLAREYWAGESLGEGGLAGVWESIAAAGPVGAAIHSVAVTVGLADPYVAGLGGSSGGSSMSAGGVGGSKGGSKLVFPGGWLGSSKSDSSREESGSALLLGGEGEAMGGEGLHAPVQGEHVEPPGPNLRELGRAGRGIAIRGLTKVFRTPDGPKPAVVDLGLDMYEGQIFVLLGHNGAGKSTTMSMLTGLLAPTAGDATVYGASVRQGMADVRKSLGVCPQHDVLWPDLTVREHLEFFAGLKGVPPPDVAHAVGKVVQEVGLTEKINALAASLSGGQKRKLSVGIALIGGSKFVVLDEPTSGMDPYSRRSTWQILQNAREGRVIILTTHFMDEADILGDRIAIMADGRVRCCGSSMFLKRRFGVGYNLGIVKAEGSPSAPLVACVQRHIGAARVLSDVGTEVTLQIPLDASTAFPALFAQLEADAHPLGVLSYGVSVTTLEEVFLKVAEDGAEALAEAERLAAGQTSAADTHIIPVPSAPGAASSLSSAGVGKERGPAVGARGDADFFAHLRALVIKRWLFATRDRRALFFQLFIPIVALLAGLALLNNVSLATWQPVVLGLDAYNGGLGATSNWVPYSADGPGAQDLASSIQSSSATSTVPGAGLGRAQLLPVSGLTSAYSPISYWAQNPNGTSQDCSALSFSPNLGLPTLYQGIAAGPTLLPDMYGLSEWLLMTRNGSEAAGGPAADPAPKEGGASRYGAWLVEQLRADSSTAYASYAVLVNSTAYHAAPAMVNLVHSGLATYVQGGSGRTTSIAVENAPLPFAYSQRVFVNTATSFVAVLFIVISVSFIPASFAHFVTKEREVSAKHQQLISGVSIPAYWTATYAWDMATYALPCAASIILIVGYRTPALTGPALPATIALFVGYGFSIAPFTYVTSYAFKSHSTAQTASLILNLLCLVLLLVSLVMKLVPSTCKADAALRYVWRFLPGYALGDGLSQLSQLPYLPLTETNCGEMSQLEALSQKFTPFSMKVTGWSLLYMFATSVLYFLLAVGIDLLLSYPSIRAKVLPDKDHPLKPCVDDDDVITEERRVTSGAASNDVIVMQQLRKVYAGDKVAVRQLSFGVPAGQVFGFLGINGAGKTSTMKMVTGDIVPTRGTAKLGGYDILTQQMDVRRLLGYCPQFDALLELLTTREHLQLYARIKGVPEHDVPAVVQQKLEEMDLVQYAGKLAGSLSGGNKRKLSVAIALIGRPPLVFLDEPSTGMDPVARRMMWRVISRVATEQKQCSIILTTHSMEEAEALCTRIGIMVGGRLRCLGSGQHLKSKFGQGYLAVFKLQQATPEHVGRALEMMRSFVERPLSASDPELPLSQYRLSVDALASACAALGDPVRARMINPNSTGWMLANELQKEGSIQAGMFAEWWANESVGAALHAWVRATFPGAIMVERHGEFFRYRLPAQEGRPLSAVFSLLETSRLSLSIAEYSLSQVSLEMVFNSLASMQEEEKGTARGMIAADDEGSASAQKGAQAQESAPGQGQAGLFSSIGTAAMDLAGQMWPSGAAAATPARKGDGQGERFRGSPAGILLKDLESYSSLHDEE